MERPARGTIATVSTGRGDDMEVITDPTAVAAECCEFGKRRIGSMQPKWFRRYDVAAEHEVWFSDGTTARSGRVMAIDDDGRYTVVGEAGNRHEQLKREQICHQWQLEEVSGDCGPDAAGTATCRDGRRVAATAGRLAAVEPGPVDTSILFRRSEEGREFRRRAASGALTPHGISRVPECFHDLRKHLASPISKATGLPVHCTDYASMIDGDRAPRRFDFATIRRKLSSIAKQKAPGLYPATAPTCTLACPTAG